ncbi:MAG TPA: hypothetical protein VLF95_14415 [Vicinamibacteria bacterium]|nr:hypothetical protein [Vicinamibacteria bacterium]
MPSSLAFVLAVGIAPAAAPAPAPPSEIVERIVAVVDERPLLLTDVQTLRAVRGLGETEALEAAIDERLMHLEAARLPQAEVSREEEDRALALLLESRATLRAEVPEPDLRRLLRRQIAILKYVEFRFRPQVRVSDEEVRRAWEEEQAGNPAGPALEDEQEAIRARLERRALDERVESWVKELRARADVRYAPALAPPGPPAPRGP